MRNTKYAKKNIISSISGKVNKYLNEKPTNQLPKLNIQKPIEKVNIYKKIFNDTFGPMIRELSSSSSDEETTSIPKSKYDYIAKLFELSSDEETTSNPKPKCDDFFIILNDDENVVETGYREIAYERMIQTQIERNEYLSGEAMDAFIQIINKETHFNMQSTYCISARIEKQKYARAKAQSNDIQIFFCNIGRPIGHWICIYYNYIEAKVYVYDSFFDDPKLSVPSSWQIQHIQAIRRLYPKINETTDIIFVRLKTIQPNLISCGVFACANIVSLALGYDPASIQYQINKNNKVDEVKSLRIHLAKIFRTKKISLFPIVNQNQINRIDKIVKPKIVKPNQISQFDNKNKNNMKGFINPPGANACYANSVMQIILNRKPIVDHYLNSYKSQNNQYSHYQMLLDLISNYQLPNQISLSTIEFKKCVGDMFKSDQQQDAQEFFSSLCKKFGNSLFPFFEFTHRIERRCTGERCDKTYQTQEHNNIVLIVDIKNEIYDFKNLLNDYVTWRDSEIKCDKCNEYIQEKCTIIHTNSKYLVLHFNLFHYDDSKVQKCSNFNIININNNIIDYNKSRYRAVGMILHSGSTPNVGHYTSLVFKNNKWLYANDEELSEIYWPDFYKKNIGFNSYILFLEKIKLFT